MLPCKNHINHEYDTLSGQYMPHGGFPPPQTWNVRFPAVRTESAHLFVLFGFSSRLSVTGKKISYL